MIERPRISGYTVVNHLSRSKIGEYMPKKASQNVSALWRSCPLYGHFSDHFFFGATRHTMGFQKICTLPILRPTDFMWNSPKYGPVRMSVLGCPLWNVRVRLTDMVWTKKIFDLTQPNMPLQNIYNIMCSVQHLPSNGDRNLAKIATFSNVFWGNRHYEFG